MTEQKTTKPGRAGLEKRLYARLEKSPWLFISMVFHVVLVLVVVNLAFTTSGRHAPGSFQAKIDMDQEEELGEEEAEEECVEEPEITEECIEEPEITEEETRTEDDFVADQPYEGMQSNASIGLGGGGAGMRAIGARRGGWRGPGRMGRQSTPPRAQSTSAPHSDLPSTGQWKRSPHRPSFARVYIGDGNALDLKRMRVTVTIEGARARTVVDHIFENPHTIQLEGTFEYPLPPGASVCYFAMFLGAGQQANPEFFSSGKAAEIPPEVLAAMAPGDVSRHVDRRKWGELREARVVHRETGRRVYEEITRRRIDPALLEYAGGNTFRGRVFPIQPHGLNRVIIAYEEHLDMVGDSVRYRFPLPACDLDLLHVSAALPQAGVRSDAWIPAQGAKRTVRNGRILYEQTWENTTAPGNEIILAHVPENPAVQVIAGPDPTTRRRQVFHARVRPEIPAFVEKPWSDRAVFLLDTSMSEHPDRFNASLHILKCILEKDTDIRRFNVMCFDVGAWWVAPEGWITNDEAGRKRALDRLDSVLLEGATDVGCALDLLSRTRWEAGCTPVNAFLLTDGQVNWGERNPHRLLDRIASMASFQPRFFCYRTGLGAENVELFRKLTRNGGCVFNVFNETMAEQAALAHRRPCFLVSDIGVTGTAVKDLVVAGRVAAVYPGGELVVAGRFTGGESAVLSIRGRIQGEERTFSVPLPTTGRSALAPRAWAEIAVNRMLATRDPAVETLAAAYAQRFHIGSRVTSFLVLEKDADYDEFNIAEEASKLRVEDMAAYLDGIRARTHRTPSRKEAFLTFLDRISKRIYREKARGADRIHGLYDRSSRPATRRKTGRENHVLDLHAILDPGEFTLPAGEPAGPLPTRADTTTRYLEARELDRRKIHPYLEEAGRRMEDGNAVLGLRALSTVVEMHPGRSDALRLVGYRLLNMDQPAYAAGLFDQVRQHRPFEPHSYRDLARSLEACRRFGLAAIHYEIALAGRWHARFRSLKTVVKEEYCRMMRNALHEGALGEALRVRFSRRMEELGHTADDADLTVTISWNTDNTDVDLWVVEPGGHACGHSKKKTPNGGELLDDLTRGYGPERYRIRRAVAGEYVVLVKYYRGNPNLIAGETHVDVAVTRRGGSEKEETQRHPVILKDAGKTVEVCRFRLGAEPGEQPDHAATAVTK